MFVPEKHYKDFGLANIALIGSVALILGFLAWSQKPIRTAAIINGTGLNTDLASASGSGRVLGATEYNQQLISQFEPIDIKTSEDNSQQAFSNYISQVSIVKQSDRSDVLLAGSAKSNKADQEKFIYDLKTIAVPSTLSDFHKLLLAYYQLKFSAQGSPQAEQLGAYAAAVQLQLDKMRENFRTSAEVILP
ncbi:MAG: hypothetical protein NVSMB66_5300 [Candidatus Doudnabacteria bacterium]